MEVYRPKKLKQGQTLNMEDKQLEKEYIGKNLSYPMTQRHQTVVS